ncbi:MAG: LysR family transcriptional regulator [Myxococcota bacterium]
MNWDDAKIFLAVLRAGSLAGAARELGCSHSTVRRRLEQLEAALGSALFVTSHQGLLATDAAREAAPKAEAIEEAVLQFRRELSGRSSALSGKVTVTTIDALAEWLAPALAAFRHQNPGVQLELVLSTRYLDLSRREADVAIRATNEPNDMLFGRRVERFEFAPFAAKKLVDERGADVSQLPWVLYTEESGATLTERWYREVAGDREPFVRVSSGAPLLALVRSGYAGALLPLTVGGDPRLVQLGPAIEGLGVDVWCLTHNDLRHSARIRAFMECVAEFAGFEFP